MPGMKTMRDARYLHRRARLWFTGVIAAAAFPLAGFLTLLMLGLHAPDSGVLSFLRWCTTALATGDAPWIWLSVLIVVPAAAVALSVARRLLATIGFERRLTRATIAWPASHVQLLENLGIRKRVLLLPSDTVDVRTVGLYRPLVVCTTGLLNVLSDAELEAVLRHEIYHVCSRDPLKILLTRAIREGFFWLPAVARSVEEFERAKELAADAFATLGSSPEVLLDALIKMLQTPRMRMAGPRWASARFSDLAEARIALLAGMEPKRPTTLGRRFGVAPSLAISVLVWASLVGSCGISHH